MKIRYRIDFMINISIRKTSVIKRFINNNVTNDYDVI